MPFKMMSPLKKMATTAMKKMKDLSGDGKVTKKDVLIGRGVLNKDGSPNKIMGGMMSGVGAKLPLKTKKELELMSTTEQGKYASSSPERERQIEKLFPRPVEGPEVGVKTKGEVKSETGGEKPKKLTGKERRKAERNIKAQQKANKKIRKGGGQQIKVDEKNTTATASDRRKLKEGAKQLEEKLSLKRIELEENKPKNKKDKKGKNKKKKGKGARNIIVPKSQNRQM